jgi:glycosidase
VVNLGKISGPIPDAPNATEGLREEAIRDQIREQHVGPDGVRPSDDSPEARKIRENAAVAGDEFVAQDAPVDRNRFGPKVENPNQPSAAQNAHEAALHYGMMQAPMLQNQMAQSRNLNRGSDLVSLRLDPEKMLRRTQSDSPAPRTDAFAEPRRVEVNASASITGNVTTGAGSIRLSPDDKTEAKRLCRMVSPQHWKGVYTAFDEVLESFQDATPTGVFRQHQDLAENWFTEPWYSLDTRFFYAADGQRYADFEAAKDGLDYVRSLGFQNIILLGYSESDWLSGAQGTTDYVPAQRLGGRAKFEALVTQARRIGLRLATSAAFNHTSVHHKWFRAALDGDSQYLKYYLREPDLRKVGESEEAGKVYCHYVDRHGIQTVRRFYDVDLAPHSHIIEATVRGKSEQFYRSLHPYQVDLNLTEPAVLKELFRLLATEANLGILGRCPEAVAFWVKTAGTPGIHLPETHALLALIKLFLKGLGPRQVIIPTVFSHTPEAATYCGHTTEILGHPTTSEGDLFVWLEGSLALRTSVYLEDKAAIEQALRQLPDLPPGSRPLAFLESQDEIPLEFFRDAHFRERLTDYLLDHGGLLFKNGLAAANRHATCLANNPHRISLSLFCLFMLPVTPLVYFGTEIGAGNNLAHADFMQSLRYQYFREMGNPQPEDKSADPAERHRGTQPRGRFKRAEKANYAPLETVIALNDLWRAQPAFRAPTVRILPNPRDNVLTWLKGVGSDEYAPLLLLANLSGRRTQVSLRVSDIRDALPSVTRSASMVDIIGSRQHGAERRIACTRIGDQVSIALPPYGFSAVHGENARSR